MTELHYTLKRYGQLTQVYLNGKHLYDSGLTLKAERDHISALMNYLVHVIPDVIWKIDE